MALIWEKINGLLLTSAAANFPPAAPPRAQVSTLQVAQTKAGSAYQSTGGGGVAVRERWADIKIRKVHLCPPGTIARTQTKSLKAEKTLVRSGGRTSGEWDCSLWLDYRKLAREHCILGQD